MICQNITRGTFESLTWLIFQLKWFQIDVTQTQYPGSMLVVPLAIFHFYLPIQLHCWLNIFVCSENEIKEGQFSECGARGRCCNILKNKLDCLYTSYSNLLDKIKFINFKIPLIRYVKMLTFLTFFKNMVWC